MKSLADGRKVPAHYFRLERRELPADFIVFYFDLPAPLVAEDADDYLETICRGAVRELEGTVLSEKGVRLGDHPGREVAIEYDDSPGRCVRTSRMYQVGKRHYHTAVVTTRDQSSARFVSRFLDSFRLAGR